MLHEWTLEKMGVGQFSWEELGKNSVSAVVTCESYITKT